MQEVDSSDEADLRQHALRLLEAASYDQLRQVVKHLTSAAAVSDSSPFRLLDLPQDLLEYTAESFFKPSEAVKVLTTNHGIHTLFTNAIWRKITLNGVSLNDRPAPRSLMRYGRQVRQLDLQAIEPGFHLAGYFPHLRHLSFSIVPLVLDVFTLHIPLMNHLKRVTLHIVENSKDAVILAEEWVNSERHSGHVPEVDIEVSHEVNWEAIHSSLAKLLTGIKSLKRIRLSLETHSAVPDEIVPLLPSILKKLVICPEKNTQYCYGLLNKQIFGHDTTAIFAQLRELHFCACCNQSELYDFVSCTPDRFPVLQDLSIGLRGAPCTGDSSPLPTLFAKKWPQVTKFVLHGHAKPPVPHLNKYLQSLPNVQSLNLSHISQLKFPHIPQALPRLTSLSFDSISCQLSGPASTLHFLKTLSWNSSILGLRAHFHPFSTCPRLVELEIINCTPAEDLVSAVSLPSSIIGHSIKNVTLRYPRTDGVLSAGHFLRLFPNMKKLDISSIPKEQQMQIIKDWGHIKIIN
ncbi:hypothetical protein GQ42DRAFT_7859 [Ramicandelaber brevisporus]|nr:hypothetical protein GQ42DRAFT_7859 [Ramicandelaber brevisporus]